MIIKCPNSIEVNSIKNKWKVFLAGPIQGAPEWQFEMPEYDNVVWFSPRRPSTLDKSTFNYNEQGYIPHPAHLPNLGTDPD